MIERVVDNIKSYVSNPKFIFIVDNADCDRFSLDKLLKILGGNTAKVVKKRKETAGALCSTMLAVDHLDLNEPLLISNCDTLLTGDISRHFLKYGCELCSRHFYFSVNTSPMVVCSKF